MRMTLASEPRSVWPPGFAEPTFGETMRSKKDVEAYLGHLNRKFTQLESPAGAATTYLIHSGESFPPVALRVDPPLVVLRVHIGDVDDKTEARIYRLLLQHNAKSLVHTSFGLEDNRIVLTSALELENLDFNELEATLDEIDVALAQHVPALVEIMKSHGTGKKD
jgi:hypothetical protein